MDNISFNIESIGGNNDYIYIIHDSKNEINEFVHKMIMNNNIKCFVPYVYEIKDSQHQLRYSSGKQITVSDFVKNRFYDVSVCATLIISILKALKMAEDYMIANKYILLDPDFMFLNANKDVSVTCLPIKKAQDGSLTKFFRDLIMPVNFGNTANGDTFKVAVYQFPFDMESVDNAISYFETFKSDNSQKSAPVVDSPKVMEASPGDYSVQKDQSNSILENRLKQTDKHIPEQLANSTSSKQRKTGLFGSLFNPSQKASSPVAKQINTSSTLKDAPLESDGSGSVASNPFGIEVPGQKSSMPKEKKSSLLFNKKKTENSQDLIASGAPDNNVLPKKNVASSTSYIDEKDDNKTVFDDGKTVFIAENPTARLVDSKGNSYSIIYSTFNIGRRSASNVGMNIDLDIPINTISHNHATIYNEAGCYFIVDNGSRNGTFVDGKRLNPNEKVGLYNNSIIRFHNTEYTFLL